jgi:hypothetical protein
MGFFTDIRKALTFNQKGLDGINYGGYSSWGSFGSTPSANTALADKLLYSNPGMVIDGNPRNQLTTYDAIRFAFPFFDDAISKRQALIGSFEFVSEDEKLAQEFNDWAENFKVYHLQNDKESIIDGFSNYISRRFKATLEKGMSFGEIIAAKDGMIIGAKAIPATRMDYISKVTSTSYDKYVLVYTNNLGHQVEIDTESAFFSVYRHESNENYLWGLPIAYNADWIAENLVRIMNSRRDMHIRFGNPVTTNVLSTNLGEFPDPLAVKETINIGKDIKEAHKKAVNHMVNTGAATDIFHTFPTSMKLEQSVFGGGITGLPGFTEEASFLMNLLISRTKFPADFLNFSTGSAGIGSDKFKILKDFALAQAQTEAKSLEKIIWQIAYLQATAMKVNPKSLKNLSIEWIPTDLSDQKLMGEADKISAEAVLAQIETYTMIHTMNPQAADVYAESIGRDEWSKPKPPPMPAPGNKPPVK